MKTFLEHIDFGLYEGKHVPLDSPMVEEEELNKPKKGGPKKFYVMLAVVYPNPKSMDS